MNTQPYYLPVAPGYLPPRNARLPTTSNSDPLEQLVSSRLRALGRSIDQVVEEIEGREKLGEGVLLSIDLQMSRLKEPLYQVAPFGSSPLTVGDPRRRSAIEKCLFTLECERRKEELGTWKDVSGLKRELREIVREYEEERDRAKVMSA